MVDQVTQRNASAAEELSSTAEEMASQAESLQATIAYFRVAEEIHKVRRAQPILPGAHAAASAPAPHAAVPGRRARPSPALPALPNPAVRPEPGGSFKRF